MAHTPGPWTIETPMGDDTPWIVEAGKASHEWRCLAMVPCDDDEDGVPTAEARANLRLIAAAPELYEALLRVVETRGKPQPEEYVDGGRSYQLSAKAHERAAAALAKARGEV